MIFNGEVCDEKENAGRLDLRRRPDGHSGRPSPYRLHLPRRRRRKRSSCGLFHQRGRPRRSTLILSLSAEEEVSGSDLAPQIERVFGFVSPSCTVKLFKDHGYEAKAYHGDILTLKQAVAEGTPVVVFIRIPHDTHYAAVTGYDEEFIYLADSMTENTNADELSYNRKVRIEEFEKLWKTGTLTANNVYITVKERR